MNKLALYCCAICLGLLLNACTQLSTQPSNPISTINNQELQQWQLSGKIGLRNGNNAHSAYLNWKQCGEHYDIRLSGPLGQGAARLSGDNTLSVLNTSDQQSYRSTSAENLLTDHFGWKLPVNQLIYWVLGIPSPLHDVEPQNHSADDIHSFKQLDWLLTYSKFTTTGEFQLPAKVIAEQSPLKVTLLIKKWQLQPDCESK